MCVDCALHNSTKIFTLNKEKLALQLLEYPLHNLNIGILLLRKKLAFQTDTNYFYLNILMTYKTLKFEL